LGGKWHNLHEFFLNYKKIISFKEHSRNFPKFHNRHASRKEEENIPSPDLDIRKAFNLHFKTVYEWI
jgi:hypothetical protein